MLTANAQRRADSSDIHGKATSLPKYISPIIFIDRPLDRQEQVGRALNLADDGPVQTPNESNRIGPGRLKHCLIVKHDIRCGPLPACS